jgi:hypothetical protein
MNSNVVINVLTLSGNKKDVNKALKLMYGRLNSFKFDNFHPYPDNELKLNYQDWIIYNWGTPSDILKSELISDNTIKFETNLMTPLIGIEYLSTLAPNVKFEIKYADEDIGYNVGEYSFLNGKKLHYSLPKEGSLEAITLSLSLWEDDYHLYEYINDIDDEDIQDGIDGNDSFVLAILRCIYNKRIVSDIYPMIVLNYLLSLAVDEEEYEYAAELKKIINK